MRLCMILNSAIPYFISMLPGILGCQDVVLDVVLEVDDGYREKVDKCR